MSKPFGELMKINKDLIVEGTNYNLNDIVLNQNGWKGTVLYSNPNVQAASSIPIDLSSDDYDFLEFYFRNAGGSDAYVKLPKGESPAGTLRTCGASGGNEITVDWRYFSRIDDTHYSVGGNYHYSIKTGGSITWNNSSTNLFLPYLVIGYKKTNPVEK